MHDVTAEARDVTAEEKAQVGEWWDQHTPAERARAWWGPSPFLTKTGVPKKRPPVCIVACDKWADIGDEQRAYIVVGFRRHGPFFPVVALPPLLVAQ